MPAKTIQDRIEIAKARIDERRMRNVLDMNEVLEAVAFVNHGDLERNRRLLEDIIALADSSGLGFSYKGRSVGLQLLATCKTGYFVARIGPDKEDVLHRETTFPPLTATPKSDRRRKANREE